MPLEVEDRVHIVCMGYEFARVWEPANELRADRVVIIQNENHGQKGEGLTNDVIEKLEELNIDYERHKADIFDFYDALGEIADHISRYSDDDVYVNTSTGSKITAVAGMIASMIVGATPFYAKADNYEGETPSQIVDTVQLPRYPIQPPEPEQVRLLEHIVDVTSGGSSVTKGDLIHFAEKENMEFITSRDVQEKGKYRIIDKEVLEPLERQGYIQIQKSGRKKIVLPTEEGKNAVEAFGYLIKNKR